MSTAPSLQVEHSIDRSNCYLCFLDMMQNCQAQSPFFNKLPSEVRISIYHQLFETYDHFQESTYFETADGSTAQDVVYFSPLERSGQVLRTCQLIFNEACPVLMKQTTFNFETTFKMPEEWQNPIPLTFSNVPHIKTLDCCITFSDLGRDVNEIAIPFWCVINSLEELTLRSFSIEWAYPDRVPAKFLVNRYTYDWAHDYLRALGSILMMRSQLNEMADYSNAKDGIEIRLSKVGNDQVTISTKPICTNHADSVSECEDHQNEVDCLCRCYTIS